MELFYMRDPATGNHHSGPDEEGVIIHYPSTCNVQDLSKCTSAQEPFHPRRTAIETRLVPSRKGFVAICYETKGLITFYAQISPTRLAWQRREWPVGFHQNWDKKKVKEAVENFLWVAECEVAQELLPKPDTKIPD